ncbi:MAG: ferredoxin family protein [Treponema sp.]|nr:ferredoxin family protein [Treponema sp.]
MSVKFDENKCIGCGKCVEVCPGNLIKINESKKAGIKHIRDCWGCTSCIKECPKKAISFFLGADIGGKGSTMIVDNQKDYSVWTIKKYDGKEITITINKKDSNKY